MHGERGKSRESSYCPPTAAEIATAKDNARSRAIAVITRRSRLRR